MKQNYAPTSIPLRCIIRNGEYSEYHRPPPVMCCLMMLPDIRDCGAITAEDESVIITAHRWTWTAQVDCFRRVHQLSTISKRRTVRLVADWEATRFFWATSVKSRTWVTDRAGIVGQHGIDYEMHLTRTILVKTASLAKEFILTFVEKGQLCTC